MKLFRGEIFTPTGDNPFVSRSIEKPCVTHLIDGAILVDPQSGKIIDIGTYTGLEHHLQSANVELVDLQGQILLPGLVDGHNHLVQVDAVGHNGWDLLDWLAKVIFPAEAKFVDDEHAYKTAVRAFRNMIMAGTTTVNILGSQFESATRIFFELLKKFRMHGILGLNLSDVHIPEELRQSPDKALEAMLRLTDEFHRPEEGLNFAITPRFLLVCSRDMLRMAGELYRNTPGLYLHTHINEMLREIRRMKELFGLEIGRLPDHLSSYAGVLDLFHLLSERTTLAHSVHSRLHELTLMQNRGCSVVNCPLSNLNLKSGHFCFKQHLRAKIDVSLGTDVAGGPSYSIFEVGQAANWIAGAFPREEGRMDLSPEQVLYLMTYGGAKALRLQHQVGMLAEGYAADIVVINPRLFPVLDERLSSSTGLGRLGLLCQYGSRAIGRTVVAGDTLYENPLGGTVATSSEAMLAGFLNRTLRQG